MTFVLSIGETLTLWSDFFGNIDLGESTYCDHSLPLRSLCLSPKEDLIVALTSDLLLYSVPLNKKEKDSAVKKNTFTTFLHPFHSGPIQGLDICHRWDFEISMEWKPLYN